MRTRQSTCLDAKILLLPSCSVQFRVEIPLDGFVPCRVPEPVSAHLCEHSVAELTNAERRDALSATRSCQQLSAIITPARTLLDKMRGVYWSFYLRKGVAYIPTTAKTEAGYWLAVEPVDVGPVRNADDLHRLLMKAIARGNPLVTTPTRQNFPPPVVQRYCGMKSFSAFERTAQLWAISARNDSYAIYPWLRSNRYKGAWEEDHARATRVPLSTSLEDVARRAAERAFNEERT